MPLNLDASMGVPPSRLRVDVGALRANEGGDAAKTKAKADFLQDAGTGKRGGRTGGGGGGGRRRAHGGGTQGLTRNAHTQCAG